MPSVGSGSNVQPSRSVAAVGASAGTVPWAAADPAAASQPIAPSPTIEAWQRRSFAQRVIVGIVARTPAGSRARRPRSGYHGAGPTLGRFGRDLLDGEALRFRCSPTLPLRICMASPPRTGRFALQALVIGAIALLLVGLAIVTGVDLVATGQRLVTGLYPPEAVTVQGEQIRDLYTIVFLIAVAIFFLVEGLILWTVLRYRRRPEDVTLPAQTHGNAVAEVVWTVVPTLIVAFLFVISWQTLNQVEIVSADPQTRIKAVAGQFQWTFEYLDESGQNTVYTQLLPTGDDGGLVLPAGRTVQLSLESPDVIHAFYVPQFLFKRDVVPGRINVFEITVNEDDAGQTFRGQCAELCGAGHRVMLFDVHAYRPADYDAWLEARIAEANASPPPAPSGPAPGGPSGPPAGAALAVSAFNLAFEPTDLQAPADTPFRIDFDNRDASVPHNVAIHEGSPTGPEVWKGEIFAGPAKKIYDVAPLPAGAYGFICTVHPSMTGTLTVN
jgi:cytochrome c oxidase subunit 2